MLVNMMMVRVSHKISGAVSGNLRSSHHNSGLLPSNPSRLRFSQELVDQGDLARGVGLLCCAVTVMSELHEQGRAAVDGTGEAVGGSLLGGGVGEVLEGKVTLADEALRMV